MKFINLYNIILESRLDDYKLQLKDQQLAQSIFSINDPKKQKMIIKWIKNGSIEYPKDIDIIDKAYEIINRKQLDYNNYDNPQQILDQFNQLNQKLQYNPDNESCFTNKVQLGKGVVVYNVQDDFQGLIATRRAVDYNFGKDSNPWCLITPPLQTKAFRYWKRYNAIPKRICFQNNKLKAFCANNELEIQWWDREDHKKTLKQIVGVEDDPKAILEVQEVKNALIDSKESKDSNRLREIYQKYKDKDSINLNLALNPNTPSNILQKLSNDEKDIRVRVAENPNTPSNILQNLANDKDYIVRKYVASNLNTPSNILQKLSNDNNFQVRYKVASNPNTSNNILQKLSNEDFFIRYNVALNKNCSIKILQKLSNDDYRWVRYNVASNPNTPSNILQKLTNDNDQDVRKKAKQKLNKY